ncbi:MAG: WD40 repeat domain-containing protein [Gammaproteobacteria bacterium]
MLDYAFKALLQSIKNNQVSQVLVPGVSESVRSEVVQPLPIGNWTGHTDWVNTATVLPDGTVVSGSKDNTLRRWNPKSGECLGVWTGHTWPVSAVTVLPNGMVLSGSDDNTLRCWNPKNGGCFDVWTGHTSCVWAVAVLPDGSVVSGSADETLRHWDSTNGQCLGIWTGHTDVVETVAVLPDGTVVSGSWDKTLRRWDPQKNQCLAVWRGHTGGIWAIAVLPDGTVVSGSEDTTLRRWDPNEGECLAVWRGHTDVLLNVEVLPDGTVLSGSYDNTLRRWDPESGECLGIWAVHANCIRTLPDGTVVTGGGRGDNTLRHWPQISPTLTPAQLEAMLLALRYNTSVTTLVVSDSENTSTERFLNLLIQVMQSHQYLTTVKIEYCGLTEAHARELLQAVMVPSCVVETISVRGNCLSFAFVERLTNIGFYRQQLCLPQMAMSVAMGDNSELETKNLPASSDEALSSSRSHHDNRQSSERFRQPMDQRSFSSSYYGLGAVNTRHTTSFFQPNDDRADGSRERFGRYMGENNKRFASKK